MADRPILFSAAMVRAILRELEQPGTGKTQTRRVLTPQPDDLVEGQIPRQLRISIGDRLYVREAWRIDKTFNDIAPRFLAPMPSIHYEADGTATNSIAHLKAMTGKFRQGMHMPRWASRITLIVTDVRVERLQHISEEDAVAEGIDLLEPGFPFSGWRCYQAEPKPQDAWACPRESFRTLWDSINGDRPGAAWRYNPWVAAISFKPVLGNIDQIGGA